jgi:hypothetical protein
MGTSNKSLYAYSLKVMKGVCQKEAVNCRNGRVNGRQEQRVAIQEGAGRGYFYGEWAISLHTLGRGVFRLGKVAAAENEGRLIV